MTFLLRQATVYIMMLKFNRAMTPAAVLSCVESDDDMKLLEKYFGHQEQDLHKKIARADLTRGLTRATGKSTRCFRNKISTGYFRLYSYSHIFYTSLFQSPKIMFTEFRVKSRVFLTSTKPNKSFTITSAALGKI